MCIQYFNLFENKKFPYKEEKTKQMVKIMLLQGRSLSCRNLLEDCVSSRKMATRTIIVKSRGEGVKTLDFFYNGLLYEIS
jgi:hypothetical protein